MKKHLRGAEAHGRAASKRPDLSAIVPLVVLFVSTIEGPTVRDALVRSLHLFFSWPSGFLLWSMALGLYGLLFAYTWPVASLQRTCVERSACSDDAAAPAARRLDGLMGFSIAASALVFAAGRALGRLGGGLDGSSAELAGPFQWFVALLESGVSGFFVGVSMAMHLEDRLYPAKVTLVHLKPDIQLAFTSVFFRVSAALTATILLLTLQGFSFAGAAFSVRVLPVEGIAPALPSTTVHEFLSVPDFIVSARKNEAMSALIRIYLFKLAVLGFLVAQLMYQIKRMIKRPLATVRDRLSALNSPDPASGRVIEIVQNDEYADVYRHINRLILKQQGQVEVSAKRLEAVITGAADPIVAFDADGKVRIYNPAAESLFGYPRERALGSDLTLFLGEAAAGFAAAHAGGLARFPWRRADGGSSLMESHLSGASGDGWTTAVLRDITRQAEFEENLRRSKAEAENASRMKSEFLANMSHELRTPLNAILGFTQLMANDRNLTDAQMDRIRVISRSGEHLLALINDILDISKIEAGRMELHESAFDLLELVRDVGDMFELKANRKALSLYTETLDGLPRYVTGDLGKLRQVLVNLLGNAVKFTAEGGVGLLVGPDSDRVRFMVRDTGRGIPEAEQDAIMQPFVQASTTDHEGGTGLGLAISSRFVAMMGGRLEVTSRPGEGSEFRFSLVLAPADGAAPRDDAGEQEIRVAFGSEVTALVVDDQEANRLVLKEMLERAGFSVVEAADGRQAVERAAETKPDLVLMDIKMPVMDGYQAVAALRANPDTAAIKVFALTASAFSHDEARIAAAGFDGFLAKPFKQSSLYRLILAKGGLCDRVEEPARAAPAAGDGAPPDLVQAAAAVDDVALARMGDAVAINDFSSLAREADALVASAPSFAAALGRAASSFDEAASISLVEGLRTAHGRSSLGRTAGKDGGDGR